MPTYTVSAPAGRLSDSQKKTIAREITRVHSEETGAQTFFAQVLFVDVQANNWFMGGEPIADEQIFVHGQIRAGRSPEVKRSLLRNLLTAVSEAGECPTNRLWGYILELPPSQMAEYGHILPEPGAEIKWLSELPAADSALMQSVGKQPSPRCTARAG